MTRLSDALERARSAGGDVTSAPLRRPSPVAPPTVTDVPQGWRFDDEHRTETGVEPTADADITDIWQLSRTDAVESVEPPITRLDLPIAEVEASPPPVSAPSTPPDFNYSDLGAVEPGKLVVGSMPDPRLVEQYNRLAATLHHAQLESQLHTLMVSSAVEAEGKTLTTMNLALTLSHSYQRRVLLVDADLRRPSLHTLFKFGNRQGLGDVLKRPSSDGKLPVHQVSPNLWVMTAGPPDPDPIGGLVSDTMRQFLVAAAEQFDWVVIDTPPVAFLPDANLLASMVDTTVLVIAAGTTSYSLVERAIEAIGRSRIIGAVLNRVDAAGQTDEHKYSSYNYNQSQPPAASGSWFPFGRSRTSRG